MEQLSLNFDQIFYKTLLSLTKRAINEIDKGQDIELECRLGIPEKFRKAHGYWSIQPNLSGERGKTIWDKLKINLDKEMKPVLEETIVYSKGSIRKISYLRDGAEISTIYQRKTSLGDTTSLFLSSPLDSPVKITGDSIERNVYMLRFAVSDEKETTEEEFRTSNENVFERKRERYTYDFGDYKFDLTIINFIEYSIELEYTKSFFSKINKARIDDKKYMFTTMLFPPIKKLLYLTFPVLKDVWGINELGEKYGQLITTTMGGANLSIGRPKNIKEREVPDLLSGYSFTNKLNGVYYRLIIVRLKYFRDDVSAVFLVSDRDILYICLDPKDLALINKTGSESSILAPFNNSIMDIELFLDKNKTEIHAFDCPIFSGENITLKSHDVRIQTIAKSGFDTAFNVLLKKINLSFEIKKFFFDQQG